MPPPPPVPNPPPAGTPVEPAPSLKRKSPSSPCSLEDGEIEHSGSPSPAPPSAAAGTADARPPPPPPQPQQQQQQQQQQQSKKKKGKKESRPPEEVALANELVQAVKQRSLSDGKRVFREALNKGLPLQPYTCNMLLFLFTGFDHWLEHLRVPIPGDPEPAAPPPPEVSLEHAEEVMAYIVERGLKIDQQYYTALARLRALKGDAPGALAAARQCAQQLPDADRLRNYAPALMAFNRAGDVQGTLETYKQMRDAKAGMVDLSEADYQCVVQAVCSHGTYEQLVPVMQEMGVILGTLSLSTAQIFRNYFSAPLTCASAPARSWDCCDVQVDPAGDGSVAGGAGKLREMSLEGPDWDEFRSSIFDMAISKERRSGEFERFVEYLRRKPADIYVDGANVGFFGTNWANDSGTRGRFDWLQVKAMYSQLRREFPDKRIMVVMHVRRSNSDEFLVSPEVRDFVDMLQERRELWKTPGGSNDDWYWLYGTVASGKAGILISNDQMRDHIFELLRPRFFLKWRHHHQYKYSITGQLDGSMSATVFRPPLYTTCVQQLPESGAWMFPLGEDRWMCARPRPL